MTSDIRDCTEEEPDCAEAVQVLYHYLDGELTEASRAQIQAHLDACHPCLEAYEFEAELRVIIASRCRDRVPADFKAKLEALILREAP